MSNHELIKLAIALFFLGPLVVLPVWFVVNRRSRFWAKGAIEGDDKVLQLEELQHLIVMFIMLGSFLTLLFMVAMKSFFHITYDTWMYVSVLIGMLGSEGIVIVKMYMKHNKK